MGQWTNGRKPKAGRRPRRRKLSLRAAKRANPPALRVIVEPIEELQNGRPGLSLEGYPDALERLLTVFGTASYEVAENCMCWLAEVLKRGTGLPSELQLNAAVALIEGMRPRDETEAMLVLQMVGVHLAAMRLLALSNQDAHWKLAESYSVQANKLFRTFASQVEALAKLRRGGQQVVRVEHVNVFSGGQAIVGNVSHEKGGGGCFENNGQPHASRTHPLRGADTVTDALPVTRRQRQGAVS